MTCRLIFAFGLMVGLSAVPTLASDKIKLASLMHSLLQVQDRIARGDAAALPLQIHLMGLLDAGIEEAGPAVEMPADDFRVLLTFAIIGTGSSAVVDALLEIPNSNKRFGLANAVVHYRRRKRNQAVKRFALLENVVLDGRLMPFIAFAKGNLLARAAPKQAVKQYDLARIAAPGTLLEEATLRRLLALHSAHRDGKRFMVIAKQYARRFLNSPYRQQYLAAVRRGVFTMRRTISKQDVGELASLMPPLHGAAFYMHIVRNGVVSGHLQLAGFSVGKIIALAKRNPVVRLDTEQLKLLTLLSKISTSDPGKLLKRIEKVDAEKLNGEDKKLLSAAMKTLRSIVAPIDPMATNAIPNTAEDAAMEKKVARARGDASSSPTQSSIRKTKDNHEKIEKFIRDSERQLQAIDDLLNE